MMVATQVKAAPASMSGGSGATYDVGSVVAVIGSNTFTVGYGQTSTAQIVASALASAINAGSAGGYSIRHKRIADRDRQHTWHRGQWYCCVTILDHQRAQLLLLALL